MPRVVKHPDVRKGEILDQAFRIFLESGYENTSLNEVILRAGMSKGMFYHYFPSKEALLLELAVRYADRTYEAFRPCFEGTGLSPLEKLQGFFDENQALRLERAEITKSVFASFYRPENDRLYQVIDDQYDALITPVMGGLIADGVRAGQFRTDDADGVAEMIGRLISSQKASIARGLGAPSFAERDKAIAEYQRRLKLHSLATDRMLGLPDGTIVLGTKDFARNFIELLSPLENNRRL